MPDDLIDFPDGGITMKVKAFTGGWRKRPKEATPDKALALYKQGLKLKEIGKMWDISAQQVFNMIKQAKISQMTPDQRQLSHALDCQEWLRQFFPTKYEGKLLRRLNLHLREIRSVLERDIQICPNGLESTVKNPAPVAIMPTGAE